MGKLHAFYVLVATTLLLVPTVSHAQREVDAQSEYGKRLKSSQTIQAHGDSPFGEQVSLYTGAMTLQQSDVVLEGMGPTISLVRSTASSLADTDINEPYAFGNWTLSIPRIETLIDSTVGWKVLEGDDANRLKRCSRFDRPMYTVLGETGGGWHGIELITETGERQQLLKRHAQNAIAPVMKKSNGELIAFPALTKENWQVACLESVQNSTGEGFFVVSPNGTKYWFNRLETDGANTLFEDAGHGVVLKQRRALATMYVTRVEDRFGNALVYEYGGDDKLDSITASDGRAVSIAWRPDQYRLIDSITVQPALGAARRWHYRYGNFSAVQVGYQMIRSAVLIEVELPDRTIWKFDLRGVGGGGLVDDDNRKCNRRTHANSPGEVVTTITHPSGLVGKFTFQATWHAQSYVVSSCRHPGPQEEFEPYEEKSPLFGTMSLTRKEISGPGLPTKAWTYRYEAAQGSTTEDACAIIGTCPSTKWVNVFDPAGDLATYIYVNRFGGTEGNLMRVDRYEGTATPSIRTDILSYMLVAYLGSPLLIDDNGRSSIWMPLQKKVIEQQGKQFVWEALAFDSYANPTTVKRSSNLDPSFTRTEVTEYFYSVSLWVLDQVKKLTDVTVPNSPVVVQETVFDPATALPLHTYSFGQLKQSFTYYFQGVLKTVTDALQHVYTFTAYKRGIAQRIDFPDNTYIAAAVDDYGQITSVRDQLNNTTGYTFDDMGRLDTITPPSGWAGSDIDFVPVPGVEFGIAGVHWRRTLTKGSARSITYYDAEWRPILTHDYDNTSPGTSSRYVANGYDAFGRQSFASFPVDVAPTWTPNGWVLNGLPMPGTRTTYDVLGRPLESIQNTELPGAGALATTTYAYPSGGLMVQVTDPRTATTTTSYQAFDTPATDAPILIQLPLGVTTALVRDHYGKTLSTTRSGPGNTPLTRSYIYDSAQRLCRLVEPETGNTVTAYNEVDNVSWSATGLTINGTGCGHEQVADTARISRQYDPMNRVQAVNYPNGTNDLDYAYDDAGNVRSAISRGATAEQDVIWTYGARNTLGLPTSETLGVDGFDYKLEYGYDAQASLQTIKYPAGRIVDYAPDALGRARQAGTYVTDIKYFANGAPEYYKYGNGIKFFAQKNIRQLPRHLTYSNAGGGLLYSQDLTYDENANLKTATDLSPVTPSRTKSMDYDDLNRLTKASAGALWGEEIYQYNALDNIESITRNGVVNIFQYNAINRLTRIANASNNQTLHSYAYDNRGNITTRDGAILAFDDANRLLAYAGKGKYRYDAWGRRVKRSDGNGVGQSYYAYSQAGQMLFEHNLAANQLTDYILLGGKLVAKVAAPSAIPTLQAPASSTGEHVVSWSLVAGATSYVLEEKEVSSLSWTVVYSGSAVSKRLTRRAHGSYDYRVKACFNYGCGNFSPIVRVVVDLSPQSAPTMTAPEFSPGPNYTVSWTTVWGTATYEIQESGSSGVWGALYSGSGLSVAVNGRPSGAYSYRGRGCNSYGCGPWSAVVTTSVELAPQSVPSLSGPSQSFNGSYGLSWTAIGGVTRYPLEESFNGGGWTVVQDTAALTWATSGKPAGSYAYRARACNPSGCSSYSPTLTVTVIFAPTSASSVSTPTSSYTGNYTVNWAAVSAATTYVLQRNVNGGAWGNAYSGGGLSAVQSVASDSAYGYQVKACNIAGCGPWSSTATTQVEITPTIPALDGYNEITDARPPVVDWYLNWTASPGATKYELQQQQQTGSPGVVYSGPNTDYHTTGHGNRRFWVRACKGTSNCSPWSNEVYL